MLGKSFKVSNDLSNSQIAFGDMSKYRMYRRQGMRVRWCTQDEELMRKQSVALIITGRFGGRLMDPSAFAKITNGQT